MPDGRVHRIDADKNCVYIIRRGRTYRAPMSEVEPAARVPSARVHFGLRRSGGVESAEGVQLRRGTRTNRRQRRFGDLTGATRPGSKLRTPTQREFGIDVTTQPLRIVETWLEAMEGSNFDGAASLYLPEAEIHLDSGTVAGHRGIRALLEDSGWNGGVSSVVLHSDDRFVDVELLEGWDLPRTSFLVHKGAIAEQWLGTEPEVEVVEEEPQIAIEVVNRSGVRDSAVQYAEERLTHVIDAMPETVISARIKLALAPKPRGIVPAHVEATLELDKKGIIRVHAGGASLTEAVDLAMSKFAAQLERTKDRFRHSPEGLVPDQNTWRHGNRPTRDLPYFERPPEEREIVRHKTVAPAQMTIEEAAWDADLMAFYFFLFEEISTGHDCLLERTDDSYIVHGLGIGAQTIDSAMGELELAEADPPQRLLTAAIEILDGTGVPFHFFINEASGRGNVLYRRVDGHYGLVTPRAS